MNLNFKNAEYQKPFVYILKFLAFLCVFIVCAVIFMLLSSNTSYPCSVFGSSFLSPFSDSATIAAAANQNPVYIIIDAGHGGEDGGAVSDNGVSEKNLNLDIADKLNKLLLTTDYIPVMIRTDDRLMYEAGQENRKKYHDITNRVQIAESYDNAIFVSIHQNKFPIKKYKGFQVYCSKNNPESSNFGQLLQSNVKALLQPENNRKIKVADEKIRILDSLHIPAVLAECGFLSNDEEVALLNTEEYRNKIAYLLYVSAVQYASQYGDGK